MRPGPLLHAALALLALFAVVRRSSAKDTVLDDFEQASSPSPWVFSNGAEFPGATGSFTSGTGHTGKGAVLAYDLTKGGHYVSATLTLTTPVTAAAIAFWAKVPAGIHAKLRITDSTGQTLQYDTSRPLEAFDAGAWFREVVALAGASSHFGGANDGVVHQPVKAVTLMAADPPEPDAGTIAFDDVVAIDALGARVDLRGPASSPAPSGAAELASRLGVNIHFNKDDAALDLASQAGFTFVRQDLGWSGVERTKGSYDFSALDGLVASLATRNMGLLLILDYMNPLYPAADSADFAATTVPAFAALAKATAQHFAGKNVRFEIWNEPNLDGFWPPKADASQYGALAKAAIAAVHDGNTAAQVTTAGISQFDLAFLRGYLAKGGADGADAIGVHPYRQTGAESVGEDLLLMRSVVSSAGSSTAPIWSTEWGYSSTWYGDGHAAANLSTQAKFAVRELLAAWAVGFPVAVYYDLRDDGTDPTNAENNFGLLGNDNSAKPAYTAVKTLTAFAKGRSFTGFFAVTPSSVHAMRLTASDSDGAVVWTDAPGAATLTVPAGTQATGMLGDTVTLTVQGTDATVTLVEQSGPVYLSLPRAPLDDAGAGDAASGGAGNAGASGASAGGATAAGGAGGSAGATSAAGTSGAAGSGAVKGSSGAAGAAGANAGTGGSGAGSPDAGTGTGNDSASCGCSVPRRSNAPTTVLVVAIGLGLWRRRRRLA